MTVNDARLMTRIDTALAMLDVAAEAFQAEAHVIRALHGELLISTDERDQRIAAAQNLMNTRQDEVFA